MYSSYYINRLLNFYQCDPYIHKKHAKLTSIIDFVEVNRILPKKRNDVIKKGDSKDTLK